MIRPTQRAIFVSAMGLACAIVPVVAGSSFSTVYVLFAVAVVVIIGVDFLLCPPTRAVAIEIKLPRTLSIGDAAPATLAYTGDDPIEITAFIDVSSHLEEPVARTKTVHDKSHMEIPLVPRQRGTATVDTLWLKWHGPLRLIERIHRRPIGESIAILPNIRAVRSTVLELFRQNELMTGLRTERYLGDGSEFDTLREFTPGLDHRTIDWKASARHRKLLNRQFRAERNHQIIVAFDTGRLMREPIDGVPKLDHAISAGLLLSYVCLRNGDRVGLYGFDAKPGTFADPATGVNTIQRIQHFASSLDYSTDETNFTLGLTELSNRLRRRSLVVLMTDFTDTITAELLLENVGRLSRKHLMIFVCLRDPTLYGQNDVEPRDVLDLHEAVVTRDLIRDREVVIRRLQRLGVHCVDTEPHRFSGELLSTYIRIRQRELIG